MKSIKNKLQSIKNKLKSIESKLKSLKNKLKSMKNKLKSIESKLKYFIFWFPHYLDTGPQNFYTKEARRIVAEGGSLTLIRNLH